MPKANLEKQLRQLTPKELARFLQINAAIPQVIDAMMTCAGPKDALVAIGAALATVLTVNKVDLPRPRIISTSVEFVVEAILAQRRK